MNIIIFYSLQPLSSSKTILISPDTVKFYASFIHPSANITDHTIEFSGTGKDYEPQELLRVPIAAPLELSPQPLIRITVGMDPSVGGNDPTVGITDGIKANEFYLIFSIITLEPCTVIDGTRRGNSQPTNVTVPGGYTLLFDPTHQFGTCTTNNGLVNSGKFNTKLDTNRRLSLVVARAKSNQLLIFNYFLIEFL